MPSVEGMAVMDNNISSLKELKVNKLFERIQSVFRIFPQDPASRTQIIKFCGVGILNTIVGYGVFFLLVNYMYYLQALLIAHIVGVTHSFIWNKYWVFKSKKHLLLEFIKFNLIYAIVFVANAIALFVSVDLLQVNPRLAQLILLPVITLVSFFGQKLWTFKDKIDTSKSQI
jgi:putative flippase GtrA